MPPTGTRSRAAKWLAHNTLEKIILIFFFNFIWGGGSKVIQSLKIKLISNENLGKNIKIVLGHLSENCPYTEKIRKKEKIFRGTSIEDEDVRPRPHILVLHSFFSLWRTRTSLSSTATHPRPPGHGSSSS